MRRGLAAVAVAAGLGLLAAQPARADARAAEVLAPASRTVAAESVLKTTGTVEGAGPGGARLIGKGSSVVLDYGREVGGLVTLHFAAASDGQQQVGLAFSESSLNVGPSSDASNGGNTPEGALSAAVTAPGSYTMPAEKLRGGFRYLTLFLESDGAVTIDGVSLQFTAAPTMADPAAYPNWFHSDDELLNRIWQAGAYTVQMDTIDPHQGRVWPFPSSGWDNSATVGVGASVLVDGAKRDRTAWPGDLGVSIPTAYVAFNDLATIRNSLQVLYDHQDPSGALPYAGPAVNFPGVSDTYHLWTLIGTADYLQYSGDRAWLSSIWSRYRSAVGYSTARIGTDGLFYVVGSADWARSGQGQQNISANVLLYRVLVTGAHLATLARDQASATRWAAMAKSLRSAINARLWDAPAGAYRDNPSSSLHPQDGNAEALWFEVPDDAAKTRAILATLRGNWIARGAHTPEWTGIHPFPGSLEVVGRLASGDDVAALELIRREWGYMLDAPIGTKSTFWEGFNDDGSFAYEGSGPGYTSLAHGWATGPTSALTLYVLGLQPTDEPGRFRYAPHPGDLHAVDGRLTLPEGPITASWTRSAAHFTMRLTAPPRTTGQLVFPGGAGRTLYLDDAVVWSGRAAARGVQARAVDGDVVLDGLAAGAHVLTDVAPRRPRCRARTVAVHPGRHARRATIYVNGRRRAVLRTRSALRRGVRVRLTRARNIVRIVARTRGGRTVTTTRRLARCARRS